MDLNLLTVFEAVARTASFSAAAKELGIPKSSASRGIARLENELGVQLLFRTTRQVSLSEAGTALYDRMTPLLRSVKAALGELPEREEAPSGTLKVTAPVDLGVLFLAEVVTRYTARYPAVSVEVHLTGRVVDLVAEGFDVALRVASKLQDSSLDRAARGAGPVPPVRVAAVPRAARHAAQRGGPRRARLGRVPRRAAEPPRHRPRARRRRGRPARIVCDDLLFVRDAVRAGAGVGLLPTFVAEADVLAGRLVRIVPRFERPAGNLHVVTPAAKHVPRKVTAFRELVLELLKGRATAASAE